MKDKGIDLALPAYGGDPVSLSSHTDRPPDYPSLHLEFDDEDAPDFPDDGTITLRYHVSQKTESDRNGKQRCSYTLEVQKLVDVKGEKDIRPSKRDTSTEDNLDRLMKAKQEAY
jgi:hypothetical protein